MFRFKLPFIKSDIVVGLPKENLSVGTSALSIKVNRLNSFPIFSREWFRQIINFILRGDRNDYGVVCRNMVTTQGVRYITDILAGANNSVINDVPLPVTFKYHAWGTGSTAEAITNTSSSITYAAPTGGVEECAVGDQASATSGNNATFTSACTITAGGSLTITEHAMMSAYGSDAVMFDKSLFTGIPLSNGESITFTYVWTLNSGG